MIRNFVIRRFLLSLLLLLLFVIVLNNQVFQGSLFDLECTVAVKNSLSGEGKKKGDGVGPLAAT